MQQDNYFIAKFRECAKILNTRPVKVVSLKFRNFKTDHDYHELVFALEQIKDISIETLGHSLGGTAYKISSKNQKILLVEHETGLEILYIAGSVASLIGLVLQISSMIAAYKRAGSFHPRDIEDVEIRKLDKNNSLIEEHKSSYLPYEMFLPESSSVIEIASLKKRIDRLERKMNNIAKAVDARKAKKRLK